MAAAELPASALSAPTAPTAPAEPPIAEAVRAWQALRHTPGRFDGAPWNEEVDRWQGLKHRTMQRLAEHLVQGQGSSATVLRMLGPADGTLRVGQPSHADVARRLDGERSNGLQHATLGELWLYRWRGKHDQLVLVLVQGRVQQAGWLYEGE